MHSFQHKKHLFFDLDHTLWDFDKNSGFAFDTIFKQQGFDIQLSDFLNIYIPRNQHYWKLYQVNQISHDDLRYYRLKDVFDALQFEVSDEMIHHLSEEYIKTLCVKSFALATKLRCDSIAPLGCPVVPLV